MRQRFYALLVWFCCGSLPFGLLAETYKITGIIRDHAANSPLPFANVVVAGSMSGTASGEDGRFELELENGQYQIQVSFIGYKSETVSVTLQGEDLILNISLIPTGVLFQEVTIYANSKTEDVQVSNITLQSERLKEISSIVPDVMRSIQALPGITANNEFSAKFNVRGGNFDENLVLVNGAQVYEPFHIKEADNASVGIFNLDLMRKVDLITGGFSARYGDRASSVLNIEYREGDRKRYAGSATLSMTNLDGYIEGPLTSKGSFIVGVRKSYLEYILSLLDVEKGARPSFYDVQGVLSHYLTPRNKLLLEFIHAGDNFKQVPQVDNFGPSVGPGEFQGEPAVFSESREDVEEEKDRYFSSLLDVQSINFLSSSMLLKGEISYYEQRENERHTDNFTRHVDISAQQDYFYHLTVENIEKNNLRIKTLEFKSDMETQVHPLHQFKAGFSYQNIHYFQERQDQSLITESFDFENYPDTTVNRFVENHLEFGDQRISARSYKLAGFLEDIWQASDNFWISIGGRADYFDINKDLNFSPRLSLSYRGIPGWTVRGAWGNFYQSPIYRQIASPVASDSNTQAIRATHYILGLEHTFPLDAIGTNNLRLRLEGYHKDYDNLIHSELSGDGRIFYSRRNDATGFARGIDLQAVVNLDRLYGWISYGWLTAKEDLLDDDRGPFPRYTDQRHTFSLVNGTRLGNGWKFNLRGFYGSGFAFTPFVAQFNQAENRWEWLPGETNSEHLPSYKRVDVRLSKEFGIAQARLVAFLDVSNLLNFKNIYAYDYRFTRDGLPLRDVVELWPVVPSLGVTIKM